MPTEDQPGDEEIRRRLAEAEETLRAIREGEVDALVVRRASEDAVFSLEGHDSYRAFMEAMDIGAAVLDSAGNLIYANGALCSLLRQNPLELEDQGLFEVLGSQAAQTVRQLILETTGNRSSRQISLRCPGGYCHVEVAAAPLSMGFGQGHAVTFTDVTERIEAAAASESERIGRAIMASSNEAVAVCNPDGIIINANAGVRNFHEGSSIGKRLDDAFPLVFELTSGLLNAADLLGVAMAGSTVRGAEAQLQRDGRAQDVVVSASPLRQSGDAIGGCIVTLSDVTDRKAIEKRQSLLVNELTHRVKNTLTLVLSIANRTIAGANGLEDFRSVFARRIEALAATHSLLADGSWGGLTVEEIVSVELAPYVSITGRRVSLDGLNFPVSPNMAVTLGLIFHELVTNAVKYGALSIDSGRVTISAVPVADGNQLVWQEMGGPPVTQPSKLGFGQTLITRGLGQTGARETKVEFHPDGVICRMFVPTETEQAGSS